MLHSPLVSRKLNMRKKLVFYMLSLTFIILFALFSGIIMLGRFESADKEIRQSLDIQMEVFEKDMSSYFESLAASSIDLSQYITKHIEQDVEISGESFFKLTNNAEKIEEIQSSLISPLAEKLQHQNCSGIFMILDATVNDKVSSSNHYRTGLYLQQNRYYEDDSIVMYRGIPSIGKEKEILPHRKWRLEFQTDTFPNYDQIVNNASLPLEKAYFLTDSITLLGTSDQVIFMAVPIVGSDGTFYGICGYEVSTDYFTTYHVQPTKEKRLACQIFIRNEQQINASLGLNCSGSTNYLQPLTDIVSIDNINDDLSIISSNGLSYIGNCRTISLAPNNSLYILAVMIPKTDYNKASIKSWTQIIILIILLLFFAISCCLYFSKRYLSPILKGLEKIKQNDWTSEKSSIPEINDLFEFLAKQDEEHKQAKLELQRLSYSRKKEVDPDNYQMFLDGLKTLTSTEKKILDYYIEGYSVKEIIDLAGIKESTIRFHNRNIYSKLNVTSLKQLLRYVAMMKHSE